MKKRKGAEQEKVLAEKNSPMQNSQLQATLKKVR